jgi:hypothetical protein
MLWLPISSRLVFVGRNVHLRRGIWWRKLQHNDNFTRLLRAQLRFWGMDISSICVTILLRNWSNSQVLFHSKFNPRLLKQTASFCTTQYIDAVKHSSYVRVECKGKAITKMSYCNHGCTQTTSTSATCNCAELYDCFVRSNILLMAL